LQGLVSLFGRSVDEFVSNGECTIQGCEGRFSSTIGLAPLASSLIEIAGLLGAITFPSIGRAGLVFDE
jgi:hypothetical protein